MKPISAFACVIISLSLFAQKDCPCCTEKHNAFDFWEGHWIVTDTSGMAVGENTISRIENGCALQEKWRGNGGSTGTSLNYFDMSDSTWNQVWTDNSGMMLELKGHFENGSMVLKSDVQNDNICGNYINQITWTPNKDGSVVQKWEMITTSGQSIRTIFHGIYQKKD